MHSDNTAAQDAAPELDAIFVRAEQQGLRLAIRGRLIALAAMAVWFGLSRPWSTSSAILAALAVFALLGAFQYVVIGSRYDRRWTKYAFITVDVALLAAAIAFAPLSESGEVPQILAFRNDTFHYFYLVLAVAAFSLAPGLVVWSAVAIAVCWWAAWGWIVSGMDRTVSWSDMPPAPSAAEYMAVFFDPAFTGGPGSRFQETFALFVTGLVLALAVRRARRIVWDRAIAERQRDLVSRTFGQYVPEPVAQALVADAGVLAPTERIATVLFLDIEGFTALVEPRSPASVIAILNGFFEAVAQVITRNAGVVISFMGDAVMATFNVPLDDPDHASHAVRTALQINTLARERSFEGASLKVRIGINTGPLAAGSVGGGGRQAYTVYGDAVNLAARLEALNKEHGTAILVSEATVLACSHQFPFREIGAIAVRGKQTAITVFSL